MGDDKIDYSIDLGDYDTTSYTISSSGVDTITLDPSTFSSMASYTTISPTSYNWGTTVPTSGTYTISGNSNYSNNTVNISTTGIEMQEGTDIKFGGQSLKEFMTKMEQRLAILVPDPKKLEKFEALQKAYEHYKTMESLCFDEEEKEPK
jgi:hypothetical protein